MVIRQENSDNEKVELALTNIDDGEVQFKCFNEKVRFLQDVKLMNEENGKKLTINSESFFTFTKETWVADSGASSLITNYDSSLEDVKIINDIINGTTGTIISMKQRKKKMHVMQTYVSVKKTTLYLVKYCKDTMSNLLFLMVMLSDS